MKSIMKLKAFMLSLMLVAMMLPIASFAQNDNIIQNWDDENGVRDFALTWTITNNSFGTSPLGSGLLVLTAVGAGYAVARRRRNRKNGTMMLLALAMIVGMTGCRKKVVEPIVNPSSNGTTYTINLNTGNGSKVNVTGANVTFTNGDKLLVAHNGRYVGALTYNESESKFEGTITTEVADPKQKLYFYFLGNKIDVSTLTPGTSGSTSCTVNISDQTGYPALPVISFSASNEDFSGDGSYSAALNNKCSLMKFNVTTPSTSPICITGMNNKVTVLFNDRSVNDGFSYSVDSEDGGLIKLKGGSGSPAEKWAIVLPQAELALGGDGTAYTNEETQRYKGNRPALDAISSNQYLSSGVSLNVNTADNSTTVDLSKLVYHYRAKDGEILTGTLAGNYKISIASGAEVTLNDVTINGVHDKSYNWAGLNCTGNATIILADGTTNTVKGFNEDYPGIHVPSGSTLTIQGTGSLNASSNGWGAGIGGGYKGVNTINCGNIIISGGTVTATGGGCAAGIGSGGNGCSCGTITISGGTVTATGGNNAAGIGSGFNESSCVAITISGGTVTATGGQYAAGIGSGYYSSCGGITIESTVTSVTTTKGSGAPNSIGAGNSGTCGTVKFGNATVYNGSAWSPNPMVAGNYGGLTLAISTTTNTNDTWTLTPAPPVPSIPEGAIDGLFSVSSTKQVYFSQGNLQYQASTGTWRFAEHQYDFIGGGNFLSESNTEWIDLYRWGTSGINYTEHATLYRPWEWAYYSQFFNPYGSLTTNLYDGAGENAGKADWGYNAISNGGNSQNSGWRTLKNNTTDNEWQYIFNSRTTANEINSTSNARYTQARINIDDWAVRGIILFPDGSIGDTPSGVTWGTINAAASNWTTGTTQCTTAGWAALEAAGCVFLPAAGKYDDSGVSQAEIYGYYWSSSYASDDNAYGMYFYSNEVNPQYSDARRYGLSVRLVKVAN